MKGLGSPGDDGGGSVQPPCCWNHAPGCQTALSAAKRSLQKLLEEKHTQKWKGKPVLE